MEPRRIASYILLEPLGHGGMAVVYRARQESLDRTVAVKVLSENLAASTEFMERFRRIFSKTPMAALRDLRMRRAARELVAAQASLDQIAYGAGYQDRTGFLRAFRKVYGCDPAEFRATVDKGDLFVGV